MASKIIPTGQSDKGKGKAISLVAGLEWRVLAARGEAGLRDMAKERSATHATTLKLKPADSPKKGKPQNREVAGFYVSLDGSAPPSKAFSVAALFSAWMREHPKALLCYNLEPETSWLVVVSIDGNPVVDAVVPSWDDANGLVTNSLPLTDDVSIVSNDPVKYPQTIKADNILPALIHYASVNKDLARIKQIPPDLKKAVLLTIVVALAVGGYYYYQRVDQENQKKKAIADRLQKDPVNLYKTALSTEGPRLGKSRESLLKAYDAVMSLPIRAGGWNLKTVTCNESCSAQYERATGTTASLGLSLKSLGPDFALIPPAPGVVDLEKALVAIPAKLDLAGVEPNAPNSQEFIQGAAAVKFQDWKTAGLSVQMQPPVLWPQALGVPAAYKGPNTIAVGKVEISAVALPLVKEVLSTAPTNIVWQSIIIDVPSTKVGNNPLENAAARLNGVFYVKN